MTEQATEEEENITHWGEITRRKKNEPENKNI